MLKFNYETNPGKINLKYITESLFYDDKIEILNYFKQNGVSISVRYIDKIVLKGNLEIINYIITTTNNNYDKQNMCYRAIETGNLNVLNFLDENKCIDPHSVDCCGKCIYDQLMYDIINKGYLEIIKIMYKNGFKFASRSVINIAIRYNQFEIARFFIQQGHSVEGIDEYTRLIDNNQIDLMKYIIQMEGGKSYYEYLNKQIHDGDINNINTLIENDININVYDEPYNSLSVAICYNRFNIIQLLIGNGFIISQYHLRNVIEKKKIFYYIYQHYTGNFDGVLKKAVEKNDMEIINFLIQKNVNISDCIDALKTAVNNNNNMLVELLIKHGVDVSSSSSILNTILLQNNIVLTKLLIKNGAIVNEESLNIACHNGNTQMIRLLLQNKSYDDLPNHIIRILKEEDSIRQLLLNEQLLLDQDTISVIISMEQIPNQYPYK